MDFNDTPSEAIFRAAVKTWLQANVPDQNSEVASAYSSRQNQAEALAKAKEWQAKKAAAGYAAITWPKALGGMGGTAMENVIYADEESKYVVPRGFFDIGLGMCIPTLIKHGNEDDRKRYVRPALYGEEVWCQLFSEPAAGSDLAGIRTKAEKDGDDWVLNGQKIWTSGAHHADYGIIVTRSDPTVAKHNGLTFFYLDMKSPGIEVCPIKQISGGQNFNEVYFTDVRVPDSQRLGAVGDGWKVSLTTLMNERLTAGRTIDADMTEFLSMVHQLEMPDGDVAIKNASVRDKLADWYTQGQGLKYTRFRIMTALSKGQTPGPEASIGKCVSAARSQDYAAFAMELMDMGGVLTDPTLSLHDGFFPESWILSPAMRIAGGTDEILRNIIAERVLGLPGDVRVDKDVPFNQLPTGAA